LKKSTVVIDMLAGTSTSIENYHNLYRVFENISIFTALFH